MGNPDRVSGFCIVSFIPHPPSSILQFALGVIYGILLQSLDADQLHRRPR